MRYSQFFCASFVLAMSAVCFASDDSDPPASAVVSESKPIANSQESGAQQLPETLIGVVLDHDGNPVANAKVTLVIEQAADLFESAEPTNATNWSASTNDDGTYKLATANRRLESGEELVLQIRVDGFCPVDRYLDLKELGNSKVPAQRLELKYARKSGAKLIDPWKDWVDDTEEFDREVAATVNDEPILNRVVVDRYRKYFISTRQEMQQSKGALTPKDFMKFRDLVMLRELPQRVQWTALRQYLTSHLSPKDLIRANAHIDEMFEAEIKKLERDLNVANLEDLEAELKKFGTSLQTIKGQFALEKLAGQCIAIHTQRIAPVSDDEVQAYYDDHQSQFEQPEIVDFQQIGFRFSDARGRVVAKTLVDEMETCLNQGEPFEEVVKRFSKRANFFSETWKETQPSSFSDRELRSVLRQSSLQEWSKILEQQGSGPAEPKVIQQTDPELKYSTVFSGSDESGASEEDAKKATVSKSTSKPINGTSDASQTNDSEKLKLPFQVDSFADVGKSTSNPYLKDEKAFFLVRVTARREAHSAPIESVREQIHKTLSEERRKSLSLKFTKMVFSKTKVRSSYGIPPLVDPELLDEDELAARNLKTLQSPDEKSIEWMNEWEIEKAIEILDFAIRQNPDNPAYFRDRGFFKITLGKSEQAIADYDESIRLDAKNALVYLERAKAWLAKSANYDRAILDLNEAIRIDPNLAAAYVCRASFSMATGNTTGAITDLNTAIQLEPKAIHYGLRASAYIILRETELALADFNEAIRIDDKCIDAYLGRCMVWHQKSDVAKQFEDLDRVFRINPLHLEALKLRASLHMECGQADRALADLDQVVQRSDIEHADVFVCRACALAIKGDVQKAIIDLNTAIGLDPQCKSALFDRAEFYGLLGENGKALSDIDQAIRLEPTRTKYHIVRGTFLYRSRDYDQALASFNEAIRLDENNVKARICRSDCLRMKGECDLAIEELNALNKLNPDNTQILLHRGLCWQVAGQLDNAQADFDDVIRRSPNPDVDAFAARAIVMAQKGMLVQAIADINEALRLKPNNAEYNNGAAWWLATATDEHCRDGRRAVELATIACELTHWKNYSYINTLSAALAEVGDFEQALIRLHESISLAPEDHAPKYNVETQNKMLKLFQDGQPFRDDGKPKPRQ